jgi:hypothetical protein
MVPEPGPTRPTSLAVANYKASTPRAPHQCSPLLPPTVLRRRRHEGRCRRHRSGLGADDQDHHACLRGGRGGGAPREGPVQGVGLRGHRAARPLVHVRRLCLPPMVSFRRPRRRRGPGRSPR